MLFAVDIDGVCATPVGSDAYAAYLREVVGIEIASTWRQKQGIRLIDALLADPAFSSWCMTTNLASINEVLEEGQYHAVKQEHCLPIDGAAAMLTTLADQHRIIYITNRKSETCDVTSSWLARYGFPSSQAVYSCGDQGGFLAKIKYAAQEMASGESLIFLDDMAQYYEEAFARLVREDKALIQKCIHQLAVIRYGGGMLPPCLFKRPVFPFATLRDWSQLDEALAMIVPFIGGTSEQFEQFFREDFEPSLLRRTRPVPTVKGETHEHQTAASVRG